jgi:hypothetical protein
VSRRKDRDIRDLLRGAVDARKEYMALVEEATDKDYAGRHASGAILPSGSEERKAIPIVSGVLDYFPAALVEVARVSRAGNEKHNPGQDLHWSRGKSTDHADTIVRHLIDRGLVDPEDGLRHSAKVAWRALALLQEELEAEGAVPGRGSKFPEKHRSKSYPELSEEFYARGTDYSDAPGVKA